MNTATKLGAFAIGLAAVFGAAVGAGKVAAPVVAPAGDDEPAGGHPGHQPGGAATDPHAGHRSGGAAAGAHAGGSVPGGLQAAQDGYTLLPETGTLTPGRRTDFRFTISGPGGRPVTRFVPVHEKKLHLIVVRRDLSGYQHLHPELGGDGVWSVPLTLPEAGVYRVFTDVRSEGTARQLTLGTDLSAPGDYRPKGLPKPERTARIDGYTVGLAGDLPPGRAGGLTLSVKKDGAPVTDLQPYLGAYGHLVALRDGDLAYLHVHPDGAPGDGRTAPGPDVSFEAEVPSAGTYRLYLDFRHKGVVRTAEFTVVAGTPVPMGPGPRTGRTGHTGHAHGH
jgi:hypothetical protein